MTAAPSNGNGSRPTVILRACPSYDVSRVRTIVREGLEELGLHPTGRTLVKPNLVASGQLFTHAHTRAEFFEGVLQALRDRDDGGVTELAVGERSGVTIPTRFSYAGAGYDRVIRRTGVRRYCFEEERQVEIPLRHEGRLRDYVYVPQSVATSDFLVNCPKFKAHPWTTVSFSMKNFIGIQDDRHRLIDHDHRLNAKVVDLQHVVQPGFIAVDGIIAGQGPMLTPVPFDLGLVIMGDNQVALDAVCCAIIGVDPGSVEHVRAAHEHGLGPVDLAAIEVSGDVSLEEARRRARGFKVGLARVEEWFEGSNISCHAGPPTEDGVPDYCWGGCPGTLVEAISVLRRFDAATDRKMPRVHVVFGAYEGEIPAAPGEKVIFVGDCTTWRGRIGGREVSVERLPPTYARTDPHDARHQDIYTKMALVTYRLLKAKGRDHVRLRGCPISVAEQVLMLANVSGAKNPYFDPRIVVDFNRAYLGWRLAALRRGRYQER
ncbi:MAG TPA: DUF362 domain-containing protein [Thermoleophilia bacterium]|nr:DUF362 domain-containing protein [Thermoleophilia bacterium]